MPISPKRCNATDPMDQLSEAKAGDIQVVKAQAKDANGVTWWSAPEVEEAEPEEEERHPSKRWADEEDSNQGGDEEENEGNNGLGQHGLRPDERKDEFKEDEPACKDSRGSRRQKGDKDDKDDRDDKSDCVQKGKNHKTARDGTREPKSQELGTAASPQTAREGTREQNRSKNNRGPQSDRNLTRQAGKNKRTEEKEENTEMRRAHFNAEVYKPSKEEREQHERTHCPFRPWCKHCVRGRGMNAQHKHKEPKTEEDKEFEVPRVSMDYFFMSKHDEEAKENPIIGMVDEQTGEKYARAAGRKGAGVAGEMDWLIQDIVAELKAWGHSGGANGHIILKCDNENSIKALRDAVGKLLGGRVIPENPPKGESQSNGRAEEAGKTCRGFAKVLRDQLEESTGVTISSQDAIALWLVRWSAMLPSRYLVGKDGRTAFERRRGRKCEVPTERFGEKFGTRS